MLTECVFNAAVDVREPDQFGFVDLHGALASGRLPSSAPVSESSFDALAGTTLSPSQIGGVPRDVFDAMEMRDNLRASISKAKRESEAKPSAPSSPEPAPTE